jgi:ankyrin repeat protein
VKALLAHGADPNAKTKGGDTALMFAAAERHPDVVRALIENRADVKARASFSKPQPRKMAPADGDDPSPKEGPRLLYKKQAIAVAQLPKDGDSDPPRPEGGFTPLLHAVMAGDLTVVRMLVDAGADVNDPAADGTTPLILAIVKHHEDVAMYLLGKGANPNAEGPGFKALHAAAATGPVLLAKALIAKGGDLNATMEMPLRLASSFIPYNPDLVSGRLSLVGATPFMLAAKSVDTEMMQMLVEAGADPRKTAKDGTNALIVAAGLGKRSETDMFKFIRYYTWDEQRAIDAIKLCLKLGLDINAANEFGETALHGATYHAAQNVIKTLVANGANLNAANWSGQTPLRLAQGHLYSGTFVRYPEVADLYRQLGADPAAGVLINFGLTQYNANATSEPK